VCVRGHALRQRPAERAGQSSRYPGVADLRRRNSSVFSVTSVAKFFMTFVIFVAFVADHQPAIDSAKIDAP
jgi:hypothetical protein